MAKIVIIAGKSSSLINFRGDLIKEWIKLGHEVFAVAPGDEKKDELSSIGAKYVSVPLSRTGINPFKDLFSFFAIIILLKKNKPDYLFLYTIKPVIYGSLATYFIRKCKVYSIITGLGYVFSGNSVKQKILKYIIIYLYRLALSKNEKVFFQNPDDASTFEKLKIIKRSQEFLVNGSGVNIERFSFTPLPDGPVTFLLIARLIWDKGIKEFMEAARMIKDRAKEAKFVLVGPYDENPFAIKVNYIETWVQEGIIEYLGQVNDVRPIIAEASVYVLPSYYREGTPRTVLEAMAMGRPVITSDAPGCRETVIEGVNGFLVPVKDSAALAGAMEKFILEPGLAERMGKESRKLAEKKYDVYKVNQIINRAMGLE